MTAKPKPSDAIKNAVLENEWRADERARELNSGSCRELATAIAHLESTLNRTIEHLDEQHAAGQGERRRLPDVAERDWSAEAAGSRGAPPEPAPGGRAIDLLDSRAGLCPCFACKHDRMAPGTMVREMVVCPKCGNKRCPKAAFHGSKCTNSNDLGQLAEPDAAPVAAPPAQPATTCQECGVVGGGHLFECMARYRWQLSQRQSQSPPSAPEMSVRGYSGAMVCDECYRRDEGAQAVAAPIPAKRLRELTEMLARDAAEHPMGQHGRVVYVSREELAELVRGYEEAEPAVPVAGEPLPSNPVEPETTRGQLQWGLDCVAGALGRPSLLVGEHAGAVAKVMSGRDAALAQIEELKAKLGEATEMVEVWRRAVQREQDAHEVTLKRALSDNRSEALSIAWSEGLIAGQHTLGLNEDELMPENPYSEAKPKTKGDLIEIDKLTEALTSANERAKRLEAERPHLLEAARLLMLPTLAPAREIDAWAANERVRLGAPPSVATGEREDGLGRIRRWALCRHDVLARKCSICSVDPPATPEPGSEGSK